MYRRTTRKYTFKYLRSVIRSEDKATEGINYSIRMRKTTTWPLHEIIWNKILTRKTKKQIFQCFVLYGEKMCTVRAKIRTVDLDFLRYISMLSKGPAKKRKTPKKWKVYIRNATENLKDWEDRKLWKLKTTNKPLQKNDEKKKIISLFMGRWGSHLDQGGVVFNLLYPKNRL